MSGHNIICIGASAGGVEALTALVSALPPDLPGAIFVVLHVPTTGTSVLPQILSRASELPAAHAIDGERIMPGRIYVAPPDRHMLVGRQTVALVRGPRENGARPAIDPLFRSAARSHRGHVIGVVLSGMLDDGAAGLAEVKMLGGIAVVQDPEDALFPQMPASAMETVQADYVSPVERMGGLIDSLARMPVEAARAGGGPMANGEQHLAKVIDDDRLEEVHGERSGESSLFTCPECGGVLWELDEEGLLRFRCHVGHQYSSESLASEKDSAVEMALWTALRSLVENALLARRLEARMRERGMQKSAEAAATRAERAEAGALALRKVLEDGSQKTLEARNREQTGDPAQ